MSCGWLCLVPLWSCSKVYMLLAYLLGYSYLGAYSSSATTLASMPFSCGYVPCPWPYLPVLVEPPVYLSVALCLLPLFPG